MKTDKYRYEVFRGSERGSICYLEGIDKFIFIHGEISICAMDCRHWQEHGYLIVYVTARPDMQHKKVVSWLAKHNFPHGMVAFMDGLSKEPLKQKLAYLKTLQTEVRPKPVYKWV